MLNHIPPLSPEQGLAYEGGQHSEPLDGLSDVEYKTASEIDNLRQLLISIGNAHNPLVNFKPSKHRGLELQGIEPDEVIDGLATRAGVFSFAPRVKPELIPDLKEQPLRTRTFQTDLGAKDQLRVRLKTIANSAKSQGLEQGFSSLHLALGFLRYYPSEHSHTEYLAPLILVPVDLVDPKPNETHALRYSDSEIGPNLALHEKLQTEFGIKLPNVDENVVPSELCSEVTAAVAQQERWSIDASMMHLGFFAFDKFMMFRDLDSANWPNDRKPHSHRSLQRIFVSGYRAEDKPDNDQMTHGEGTADEKAKPEWPKSLDPVVLDADSSQMRAINAVKGGGDLLIQVPPGTGKSQTNANIIADCVSRGKTVLFVAEKMAALEVVKRRLDEIDLGHLALELHSHKSNKKAVLESLQNDQPNAAIDAEVNRAEYWNVVAELDSYAHSVSDPILSSGMTYSEICAGLEELSSGTAPQVGTVVNLHGIDNLTKDELQAELSALEQLCDQHVLVAPIESHPFRVIDKINMLPSDFNRAIAQYGEAKDLCDEVLQRASEMANCIGLPAPHTVRDVEHIADAAERVVNGPPIDNLTIRDIRWEELRDTVDEVLAVGPEINRLRSAMSEVIPEGTWDLAVGDSILVWRAMAPNPFSRWFSKDFRYARRKLAEAFGDNLIKDRTLASATFDQIDEHHALRHRFDVAAEQVASMFGDRWRGDLTNFGELQTQAHWVWDLRRDVNNGIMPPSAMNWKATGSHLDFNLQDIRGVRDGIASMKRLVHDANRTFNADLMQLTESVDNASVTSLSDRLGELAELQFASYQQMREFNRLREAFKAGRFGALLPAIENLSYHFNDIESGIRRRWLDALRDHALFQHPKLASFNANTHNKHQEKFNKLDRSLVNVARRNARMAHQATKPTLVPDGPTGILQKEFAKKKKHLPIRKLIEKAGSAIQRRKPVFMMSPMSVAKFLTPQSVRFDVVVFDEASQLRPEHAIGAVLRGDQLVVVGDDKQLPPTSFFQKIADPDADEDDEEAAAAGLESILDLMNSKNAPSEQLRWHYRSRHEDLISFSNEHFYKNRLITSPQSGIETDATGLQLVHLPDCRYIGEGNSVNPSEAREVAAKVIEHARTSSGRSMGVVAFSVKQRDRILDELETLRKDNPDCEDFFADHGPEPFFVKNLENVQGDERDVIYISIGYGRNEDGKLNQNFGPINKNGGERRLNVLVTRAKLAMKVFCNFKAEHVRTTANTPLGVKVLKEFLAYAAGEPDQVPVESNAGAESPFEAQVADVVRELGYDVEHQLGSSGFRIDIGVPSKTKPGSYMLAIECDGASYHSLLSVRDRDRLRQRVLEDRGWRIHRIWSTDWFNSSPQVRKTKLHDAIKEAESHETKVRCG